MPDIAFAKSALPRSGALVLLIAEDATPDALHAAADEATGGAIARALEAAEFKGAKAKSVTILAPGAGLSRVVAVGLGKEAALTPRMLEEVGGAVWSEIARDSAATIAAGALTAEQAASVALGALLKSYRFDRYRTKEKPEDKPRLAKISVLAANPAAARDAWAAMSPVADAVSLTRDLVSEPPNVLNPAEMAERCRKLEEFGVCVACNPVN